MAKIRGYAGLRHLKSEPNFHIVRYKRGKVVQSGRGLVFWFLPINTSILEIPVGDHELPFLFHGRSRDFQDTIVQGSVTYRVLEPETLASRLDFSIDLSTGAYIEAPLDQLASIFTGHAQQIAGRYLDQFDVRSLLEKALSEAQEHLESGLRKTKHLLDMGLQMVSVHVNAVSPSAELEKALQTPTRETLKQEADEATFKRRALAVEKELAIAENELFNQIALAKRERTLIEERGENEKRRVQDEAQANTVQANGRAETTQIEALAQSEQIRLVHGARAETEKQRLEVYRDLPPEVLLGLAAQEFAGKLKTVEHLSITPDMLTTGLSQLMALGLGRSFERTRPC